MAKLEEVITRDVTANRPAFGIAGQLFYDTTLEKWERDNGAGWDDCEPAGALPAADFTIWNPDVSPAAPGADDDEFDGASGGVPPGWTEVDFDGNLTVTEVEAGCKFVQATHANNTTAGIYKTIPAGDFTIWAKLSLLTTKAESYVEMQVWEDPTDNSKGVYKFQLCVKSASAEINVYRFSKWDTWAATVAQLADVIGPGVAMYFRIRRTSTTYAFDWSNDGIGWECLSSGALAFTPTAYGIGCDNANSGANIGALGSFFRYVASDVGTTGIVNGDRVQGWRA